MSNASILPSHRIIGIGNAGVNFLDSLLVAAPSFSGLVAMNNDVEALAASVVANQISWNADLEISSTSDIAMAAPGLLEEIEQASVVVLVGGLGGSFASLLLPQVAAKSKAAKKLTIACVTLPFSFEGKRSQTLAAEALAALENNCDGIILLDNNRLCSTNASTAAFGEAFVSADKAMQACIPALLTILFNKGPVRIARAHFLKALQRRGAKTYFGYGQATGPNRLHEAVERALKSPPLERGRCFSKAKDIFLLLRGPKDISFAEAQAAMHEVERLAPAEHDIQLSVHAEGPEGTPLQIFLLAVTEGNPMTLPKNESPLKTESLLVKKEAPIQKEASIQAPPSAVEGPKLAKAPASIIAAGEREEVKKLPEKEIKELFPTTLYETPDESNSLAASKVPAPSKVKQTQGALNLKAVQRGRFDKSEPTIVEGEDLDTPTYLRLGLKLN